VVRFFSPAKINLFLQIIDRRQDGYHELATLMQTIDLGDWLTFRLGQRDRLRLSDPALPADGSNLILRAADLFRERTGLSFGVEVELDKRIPIQGGLGGGSSNAATTLWALNELCDRPASLGELIQWSGEIGSDIPFFFSCGTALCTGRGEIVRLLEPLPPRALSVVAPQVGLATASIFQRVDLALVTHADPEDLLLRFYRGETPCFNDLTLPAYSAMPELGQLHRVLEERGSGPIVMSGTGSSLICFGAPPSEMMGVRNFLSHYTARSIEEWYPGGEEEV
jgi:4-diphosphocytidyl-2-C-methyl-D-erythritol kinase